MSTARKDPSVGGLADKTATEFSKAIRKHKYREGGIGSIFSSCFRGKSHGVRGIRRGVGHKASCHHKPSVKGRKV